MLANCFLFRIDLALCSEDFRRYIRVQCNPVFLPLSSAENNTKANKPAQYSETKNSHATRIPAQPTHALRLHGRHPQQVLQV